MICQEEEQNPNVLKVCDYMIYHKQMLVLHINSIWKTTLEFLILNPYEQKEQKTYFEGSYKKKMH